MLTQEMLKDIFHYDPLTGLFTRIKTRHGAKCCKVATPQSNGYVQIKIYGTLYKGHRLAWLYMYGVMPSMIDHKNINKGDNRIKNLRIATHSQNNINKKIHKGNSSGFKGVSFVHDNKHRPWAARIKVDLQSIFIGYFSTPEEAHAAYCQKGRELHGDFFCAG